MLSDIFCNGVGHLPLAVNMVFKKELGVAIDDIADYVNNLVIGLNFRTTTDIKILYLQTLLLILLELVNINSIGKRFPPTNISPITSTNIEISPENFLTDIFNPFATLQ